MTADTPTPEDVPEDPDRAGRGSCSGVRNVWPIVGRSANATTPAGRRGDGGIELQRCRLPAQDATRAV